MKTHVVSVFPACGKTYMVESCKDLKILDSDSSNFSWYYPNGELSTKVRNPEFPDNYITYIKNNIGKYDYIFVSSHDDVRYAMDEAGIEYSVVFPDDDLLDEWIGRCYRRSNNGFPIEVLIKNWDNWIEGMKASARTHNFAVLTHGKYLSDCIPINCYDSGHSIIEVR